MFFLVPVNAWWLMLFFRPAIKSLFTPTGATTRTGVLPNPVDSPAWLKENFMPKFIIGLAAALLLIVGAVWLQHRNSPMREIERSRDALASIRSNVKFCSRCIIRYP